MTGRGFPLAAARRGLACARRHRPDGWTLFLAALCALGIASVLARQITYGLGLYWDSIEYIAVARNLLAAEGFTSYNGGQYSMWPPLYPLLLVAASLGVFDPLDVAGPLNAALFGLTIFAVGRYLRQRLASRMLGVWACAAVALSASLANMASYAMSDPLFVLLVALALIWTDKFLSEGGTSSLAWAALFSALAWQTRYIGLVVLVVAGLALLLQKGASWPQRARRVACFSFVAAAPMGLWLLSRYWLMGYFTTQGSPIDHSAWVVLGQLLEHLRKWMHFSLPTAHYPAIEFLSWQGAAPALCVLAAAGLMLAGCTLAGGRQTRRAAFDWRPLHLFGGFALAYLITLFAALSLDQAWTGMEGRYVVPLYIPLLMVAAFALDRLLHWEHEEKQLGSMDRSRVEDQALHPAKGAQGSSLLTIILGLFLALHLVGKVASNLSRIKQANSQGPEAAAYNSLRWKRSETLAYIRKNPLPGLVYSNEPVVAYLHNDRTALHRELPASQVQFRSARESMEKLLANFNFPDGASVVWFKRSQHNQLYDYGASAQRASPSLAPVVELPDGIIFKAKKDPELRLRQAAEYQSIVSGDLGEPAARSAFDVYLAGNGLIYIKAPCAEEDAKAMFFLHVFPEDTASLPALRKRYGFANLDFSFLLHGTFLDGKCFAIIALPDYAINRVMTGQYIPGSGRLWEAEFSPSL